MARGVNKVILIGNLGDEPTVRTTNTGRSVASISMVTNESRRNAETGEYTEFAEWHRVTMWGKLADIAKQYLHKGSQIYIEGKLRTRSYQDKDNQKRYITELVADEMQMLGRAPANANASSNNYGQSYGSQQNQSAYGSSSGTYGNAQPYGGSGNQFQKGNQRSAYDNSGYAHPQNSAYGQQPPVAQPQATTPVAEPEEPAMTMNDDIPF